MVRLLGDRKHYLVGAVSGIETVPWTSPLSVVRDETTVKRRAKRVSSTGRKPQRNEPMPLHP